MSDEEHKQLGQFEWFKDTRLFREDWEVSSDMWRHWNLGSLRVNDSGRFLGD